MMCFEKAGCYAVAWKYIACLLERMVWVGGTGLLEHKSLYIKPYTASPCMVISLRSLLTGVRRCNLLVLWRSSTQTFIKFILDTGYAKMLLTLFLLSELSSNGTMVTRRWGRTKGTLTSPGGSLLRSINVRYIFPVIIHFTVPSSHWEQC